MAEEIKRPARLPGWIRASLALWQRNQQARFLLVGAFNTAFGYLVFVVLFLLAGSRLHYLLVAVLAHFLAVIAAFLCHRRFVFRAEGPWFMQFIRYNLSVLGVMLAGLLGLYLLVSLARLHPLPAQAVVTCLSVVVSYVAHRHFTFRFSHKSDGGNTPQP